MSSARYIEFDSTYRDRTLYPLSSDFVVEMSQSGQGTKLSARDPVSDASPILIWNNNFIAGTTGQNYIDNLNISPGPLPGNQGNTVFQLQSGANQLKQVRNFYVGCTLVRDSAGNSPTGVVAPFTARRIIDYQPLDTGNAMITLDSAMPDSLVGLGGFYITNPTPIPTNTASATVKAYIPGSNSGLDSIENTQNYGLGSDNYYINFLIMNTDTGTSRIITAFDAVTRLATLDSPTPGGEDWGNSSTANFVIRKSLPIEYGFGGGWTIIAGNQSVVQLEDVQPTPSGTYDGDFLRITPALNAPTPYDVTTNPPFAAATVAAYPNNPQTEERRIRKFIFGEGTITSVNPPAAPTVIGLGPTASSVDGFYVGCIITDKNIPVNPAPYFLNISQFITAYNGTTKKATLSGPLINLTGTNPALVGDSWFIRTVFLSSPLTYPVIRGNLYEIEQFTRDNYNPFVYTGSLVSSQESVCYEVELLNLILPNAVLASGRGGRPIFYPYLYVMLQPVSSDAGTNKNIIYSNNPNSYGMLYRAVVDDTPVPAISPFIKIDGDGMVHVIKFKPNTAFRFAVFHSGGDAFKTTLDEQYSPSPPNALTQISACFAFKRV